MLANSIASWDGQRWDTLGSGALGTYGPFLTRYKNKLYLMRGQFLYAWDFATSTWDTVPGSDFGTNGGYVRTACIDQNNDLIIAGVFDQIGNLPIKNIARFDGTNFYPIGNPTFPVYIRTVAIYQNEIYIGGNFYPPYKGVAKWDGSQWVTFGDQFAGANEEVSALTVYRNKLYAGGTWVNVGTKYMPSIAAWDGSKWNYVGGIYYDINPWGVVAQFLVHDNKLYACGNFNRASGLTVDNIAIWNDTNWCAMNTAFQSPAFLSTFFRDTLYLGNQIILDSDSVRGLGYYIGPGYMGACGPPVGIHERTISTGIKLYPNPATSVLTIEDEQHELDGAELEVFNYLGQRVIALPFKANLDVSSLSPGCYFISIIQSNGRVLRSKFIKN